MTSIIDKIFGKKEEESLSENHKLSDQDVKKGKIQGKIYGDPIIKLGE